MVTRCTSWVYVAAVLLLALVSTATAKYSGGTGEPNDPYQIATAADLIALGETPADYDKHFILTADIDLDPNLPGRKVFDKAVIAPDTLPNDFYREFQGTSFTGVFDGNGRTVSHLAIEGQDFVGLFGQLASGAEVKDLGVVDVNVSSSGRSAGALVGHNGPFPYGVPGGSVTRCYSTGVVSGTLHYIGGLVGSNGGAVTQCCSRSAVSGGGSVGGLVGLNYAGNVTQCYSTGAVSGSGYGFGGLVGHSTSGVAGSFWDIETSGRTTSAGGTGLTTARMQTASTFSCWAGEGVWTIDEGEDYPRLSWENAPGEPITRVYCYGGGTGTQADPYLIYTAEQLSMIGIITCDLDKHFKLMADIDLDPNLPGRKVFDKAVIAPDTDPNDGYYEFQGTPFTGVFDGNGRTVSHLAIEGQDFVGLFGQLASGAEVKNLGVLDVNIVGSGYYVGRLIGQNGSPYEGGAIVSGCYSTGVVTGAGAIGGLVGENFGAVIQCYSTGTVSGTVDVGGLVGRNTSDGTATDCHSAGAVTGEDEIGGLVGANDGDVARCYSTGAVDGNVDVAGLVGLNQGTVTQCYSTGAVSGGSRVGGLVGTNGAFGPFGYSPSGKITQSYSLGNVTGHGCVGGLLGGNVVGTVICCYSAGAVSGTENTGGLVGAMGIVLEIDDCFWDIQTSGTLDGVGGIDPDPNGVIGKTTAEMQDIQTYQDARWDFVGEISDGLHEIWQIPEGGGYPILAILNGYTPPQLQGQGTPEDPFLISDALELAATYYYSPTAHYRVAADIDLAGIRWGVPVIPSLAGTFDGNGHTISHLTIKGASGLGLFGVLEYGAEVKNLGVVDVNIIGSGSDIGGLAGYDAYGTVTDCYSTGAVNGRGYAGGLVGGNGGTMTRCYSAARVSGVNSVGGLMGANSGSVTASFWDTQTSGQTTSAGGMGKTTAEMQRAKTFLDAGWDFVGETANGTDDIWKIAEGLDCPRLWWEGPQD